MSLPGRSEGSSRRAAGWGCPESASNNPMNQETNERIVGAAPAGAQDRESAAQAVREMFTSIAPRYDLLNHVLSFNIDRLWWWRTARKFDAI
jgi:hypothetical protein